MNISVAILVRVSTAKQEADCQVLKLFTYARMAEQDARHGLQCIVDLAREGPSIRRFRVFLDAIIRNEGAD